MSQERPAQCILGNGECPKACPLNSYSQEITDALGDNFDPQKSRMMILFADANNHDVNIIDIAKVMTLCVQEAPSDLNQIFNIEE